MGEPFVVTHCPLTGTVTGFRAPSGTQDLTFGTPGLLVNSHLLMYDRQTGSEWPQLLGTVISGPETDVLSTDTGLVLGTSTAAALLPTLVPLRPVSYPLTLVMLISAPVWGASRTARSAGMAGGIDDPTHETSSQAPGAR